MYSINRRLLIMNRTQSDEQVLPMIFLITFDFLCIILNVIMIYYCWNSKRTTNGRVIRTFKFVISQCISDILCGFMGLLSFVLCSKSVIEVNEIGCATYLVLTLTSFMISELTIMVIAVDRLQTIKYHRVKKVPSSLIITAIWVIGFMFGFIVSIELDSSTYFGDELIECRRVFRVPNNPFFTNNYHICLLGGFMFVSPLICVIVCYTLVFKFLYKASKDNVLENRKEMTNHRTKRVLYMVISFVMTYYATTTPMIFYQVFLKNPNCNVEKITAVWLLILHKSSAWINPIVYGCFNTAFIRTISTWSRSFRDKRQKSNENLPKYPVKFSGMNTIFKTSTHPKVSSNLSIGCFHQHVLKQTRYEDEAQFD